MKNRTYLKHRIDMLDDDGKTLSTWPASRISLLPSQRGRLR
jgi:hypothetical protein